MNFVDLMSRDGKDFYRYFPDGRIVKIGPVGDGYVYCSRHQAVHTEEWHKDEMQREHTTQYRTWPDTSEVMQYVGWYVLPEWWESLKGNVGLLRPNLNIWEHLMVIVFMFMVLHYSAPEYHLFPALVPLTFAVAVVLLLVRLVDKMLKL